MLPHCGKRQAMVGIREAKAALRQHEARLMAVSGVSGVGIQDAAGGAGQVLAVYVARNADKDAIPAQLETTVAGRRVLVPVRQFEVGVVKAQAVAGSADLMQMQMQDFK